MNRQQAVAAIEADWKLSATMGWSDEDLYGRGRIQRSRFRAGRTQPRQHMEPRNCGDLSTEKATSQRWVR